ncbi:Neurochondrin protein-like [Zostera marina]|uniref:Neurochondrin protein-like n=1 Tax=Zostera marina TaxID=29655 RepID=A0A0K9P372_ZOSMR|nr:Neurochondrin protein-like [Zostera marina]
MEDCLKLLGGERDEQKLAGLLLATKFCQGDDKKSILRVYNAVGVRFLNRLLKSGMMQSAGEHEVSEERKAYLRLSVTILAAFCRIPEIASLEDMIAKVPFILEIISKVPDPIICEECYEILFLVCATRKDGPNQLYESGAMDVLATHISTLPDGSRSVELVMKLLQLITTHIPIDILNIKYQSQISCMVVAIAKQFGVLQTVLKFDALHLLNTILSSKSFGGLSNLISSSSQNWTFYIHDGIVSILQNRVVSSEKIQALALADSMITIGDEKWLLGYNDLPSEHNSMPADKCLLLFLESSRVEVSILLNEIAYLKYEARERSSLSVESLTIKQRNLAISFSLIENIIKMISGVFEGREDLVKENTLIKAINGLDETASLVLDFLHDAKDHGEKKGDDLLASVRLLGSYLAEAPSACKENVQDLLSYILSIEGMDEKIPFYSICFMLPMLSQTTIEVEGCKALVSFDGHKIIADCLVKLIGPVGCMIEDSGTVFLACDTFLNLLLKMNKQIVLTELDQSWLFPLLSALVLWTEKNNVESIVIIVSSICVLIFDHTSEVLLKSTKFDEDNLKSLFKLIARSCDLSKQEQSTDNSESSDLRQIVIEGYGRWKERFPDVAK